MEFEQYEEIALKVKKKLLQYRNERKALKDEYDKKGGIDSIEVFEWYRKESIKLEESQKALSYLKRYLEDFNIGDFDGCDYRISENGILEVLKD